MTRQAFPISQRISGWQLNCLIIVLTVVLTDVVVAGVSLLLLGRIGPGSMLVSTVSGLIIATLVVSAAGAVRAQITKAHQFKLQQGIEQAQSHLSVAIETAKMLFWELNLSTGQLKFDHGKLIWQGLPADTRADSIDQWMALMHPDDRAPFMQHFQAALAPGAPDFTFDYRLQQATGDWGWVHTRGRVKERNAQGEPWLAVGGTININQRKQAELTVLENKERLEVIFNDNPDIMLISRLADGCITEANEAFIRHSGFSRQQVIGNTTLGLGLWVDKKDRQRITDILLAQGRCDNLETTFYNHAGDTIDCALDAVATLVHGVVHIVCTVRDIRQLKHAQAEQQASEILLRTTLASTDEGILMVGQDGQVLSFNPKFLELWKLPEDLAAGAGDEQLLALMQGQLSDPQAFVSLVQRLHQSDAQARDTLHLKDGRVFARFTRSLEIAAQQGRIWCFRDITQQTRNHQALVRSLNLLEAVVNHSPIRIFWKDIHLRYLGCNLAFAQDVGLTRPDEVIGKLDTDFSWSTYAADYMTDDRRVLGSGTARLGFEEPQTRPDGQAHWLRTSKVPLYGQSQELIGVLCMYEDITEHKLAEQKLRDSEQRTQSLYTLLRRVADNVPDMIWAKDIDKRFLFVNKAVCEQLLMASDTNEPIGKDDLFFATRARASHPDNPEWHTFGELCQDSDAITLQRGCASQFDEFGNVQGKMLYLDVHKAPLIGDKGELIGVVGSGRDVTADRDAQEKLRVAAAVLANSSEALLLSDADNQIVDINPAFTKLTGYTLDEVLGKNPSILCSGRQSDDFYRAMWAHIKATGNWQGELWNRRKNGEIFAESLAINTLYHDDGSVHRRVGLFSDITDKKHSEDIIWKQANFDHLTGLPNRRMLNDRLNQTMAASKRSNIHGALLFLDLDNFKPLNDGYGHGVGDLLLVEVAQRLIQCVREADTVARFGGDEFVVLLSELHPDRTLATELAHGVAEKIRVCVAAPYTLTVVQPGQTDLTVEHHCSVSMGVAVFGHQEASQTDILRCADAAMYQAKQAGRNTVRFYSANMPASPAAKG